MLEAGVMGLGGLWQWLAADLANGARVCRYDRAGLGASDPNPDGFDPAAVRRDLKAALDAAGEQGPFILVGHSLGGVFVRSFAAAYPGAVRALVLIDPAHEDQLERFDDEGRQQFETFRVLIASMPVLARLGILNFWNPMTFVADGLDDDAAERVVLQTEDPSILASAADEVAAWEAIMDDRRRIPVPPDIPVLVVTAGSTEARSRHLSAVILALHKDLAGRSEAGEHMIVDGADHFTVLTDQRTAERVADIIRTFVETIATR